MNRDQVQTRELAHAGAASVSEDGVLWGPIRAKAELWYEREPGVPRHWRNPDGTTNPPDVVAYSTGNLLLRGGASLLWEYAKGSGSTASTAAKKYMNATAALAVGNSTVAAAATQTALQGGSQKYKVLSAAFPTHTTGSTAATVADIVYKSTFTSTEANFAWNEWGIANKATTTNRRLVNRKVQALLTKTSAATASLTVTITLS